MRIGIITDAIDDRAAGIATYVRNLVDELYKIDKENEYFLIHHQVNRGKYSRNRNEINKIVVSEVLRELEQG